jgi:hypothetical protein
MSVNSGTTIQIPVGPLCKICIDLKKAWPLLDLEGFIARFKSDRSMRTQVEAARVLLLANKNREFDLPSLVDACRQTGYKVIPMRLGGIFPSRPCIGSLPTVHMLLRLCCPNSGLEGFSNSFVFFLF